MIERKIKKEGLSFAEGLRLLSGVSQQQSEDVLPEEIATWSKVSEGDWLQSTLSRLRNPNQLDENNIYHILKKSLLASLRPYQERGVQWLWWLYNMHLGGCLADDPATGCSGRHQDLDRQPHLPRNRHHDLPDQRRETRNRATDGQPRIRSHDRSLRPPRR